MKATTKAVLNKVIIAYLVVGLAASTVALFFRPEQLAIVALASITVLFLLEKYLVEQTRGMVIPKNPLIQFSWLGDALPAFVGAMLAAWRMASVGENVLLIGFVVFACMYSTFASYSLIEKSEALGITRWTAWAKPFLKQ